MKLPSCRSPHCTLCVSPSLSLQHTGLKLCSLTERRWLKWYLCPLAPAEAGERTGNKARRGGFPPWGSRSPPEPLPRVGRGTRPPSRQAEGTEHPARTQLLIPHPQSGDRVAGRNLGPGVRPKGLLPSGVCCARVEAQVSYRQFTRNTSL